VPFGELAGQHDLPLRAAVHEEILQSPLQAVGGFVEDDGALFLGQLLQACLALTGLEGQKALEDKSVGGQARSCQRGHRRHRARYWDHRYPSLDTGAHQLLAWIGKSRCAGIADEGH
jgi:hypothetical protein